MAAFSFVNLSVIRTYWGQNVVKYVLIPFLGFAFTIYLWTQLSSLTFKVGLSWLAAGFIYLLVLTRAFRKPPPAMYTGEEEEA